MKKITVCILMSVFLVLGIAANSYAILVLSGDGNITNSLANPAYDNQQFFSNVLQGGSNVAVLDEVGWGGAENFDTYVNDYYNTLSGVTSSIVSGDVTDAVLAGVDLFVVATPDDAFTAMELAAMSNFYSGGGSIFFLGENSGWDATSNLFINDALAFLGSGMSINYDSTFDGGFHTATGSQIAVDSLTAGVASFQYAAPDAVMVDGGTGLFYGTYDQLFVAYEDNGGNGDAPVPEPATMFLFGTGLVGLVSATRKKMKK